MSQQLEQKQLFQRVKLKVQNGSNEAKGMPPNTHTLVPQEKLTEILLRNIFRKKYVGFNSQAVLVVKAPEIVKQKSKKRKPFKTIHEDRRTFLGNNDNAEIEDNAYLRNLGHTYVNTEKIYVRDFLMTSTDEKKKSQDILYRRCESPQVRQGHANKLQFQPDEFQARQSSTPTIKSRSIIQRKPNLQVLNIRRMELVNKVDYDSSHFQFNAPFSNRSTTHSQQTLKKQQQVNFQNIELEAIKNPVESRLFQYYKIQNAVNSSIQNDAQRKILLKLMMQHLKH